jgi:hypothetical protein
VSMAAMIHYSTMTSSVPVGKSPEGAMEVPRCACATMMQSLSHLPKPPLGLLPDGFPAEWLAKGTCT